MPNPSFSLTQFLLGFAIGLWIALVALFIFGDGDDEAAPAAATTIDLCCGRSGEVHDRTLWIPGGDDRYYCANNDNGGGYVEDNGGGHVDDNGGGHVDDETPRVPAPTSEQLPDGRDRDYREFQCEANDNGGGHVDDAAGRTVAVPIPNDPRFVCWRDGDRNAVVLRTEGEGENRTYTRIRLDRHRNVVLLDEVADPDGVIAAPGQSDARPEDFLFCMVPAVADGDPGAARIIDRLGACVAGGVC